MLEGRLERHAWIAGDDYTIADIATFPWVRNLVSFYEARDLVGFADFPAVGRALDASSPARPSQRGLAIPAKPAEAAKVATG